MIFEEVYSRNQNMSCLRCNKRLGIFPVLFCTLTILTFIVTYIIAVYNDHLYPYFPTISDTGGRKPESNIFTLFLGASSFLGLIVVIIRYVQYRHISEYNEENHSRLIFLNKIAFTVGVVACIGALLVASFQDRGKSVKGHVVGALAVFGGGVIYCIFQTYLTYRMLQCAMNSRSLCLIRILLSTLSFTFLLMFLILFLFATKAWEKDGHDKEHNFDKWQPGDGGYTLHVISSVAEWLCAVSLMLYFLTFTVEFNKIKLGFNVRRHDENVLPFQTSTEEQEPFVYA